MAKLPYMQFYPADYLRDTRCLSMASRGAWIDILCALWNAPKRGMKTLTLEGWAGELGKPSLEVSLYLTDLKGHGIAKILYKKDGKICIVSRRMVRDERVRKCAANRQQKQRKEAESRQESRPRHSDVTGIYQKSESEIRNQKSEEELREEKKKEKTPLPPNGGAVCVVQPFDQFWAVYPRKVGKKAAMKAWFKIKDRPPVLIMTEAIQRAKETEQWKKDGGQFIPHPATWLSRGQWEDEPVERVGASDPNGFLAGLNAFIERG